MGRKIQFIFEILIFLTLFSMFSSFTITTFQTDKIVDITEEFTELVRYKGCITEDMYYEYLEKYPTPVSLSFEVERGKALKTDHYLPTYEFTGDVMSCIEDGNPNESGKKIYTMDVGDSIQVIVRKAGRNYFESIISSMTGTINKGSSSAVVSVKGGLVLNEAWHS